MSDIFKAVYKNGLAACTHADIKTDTMEFTYKDESFTLPSNEVHPYSEWNGYFYTCPIDKIRSLEAEQAKGK